MEKHITFRTITQEELNRALFAGFHRRQVVTNCLRRVENGWIIKSNPFIDDWSEKDYETLLACLKGRWKRAAFFSAFAERTLKGFACVLREPFGAHKEYLDLACIHVSQDMRHSGIGRQLFQLCAQWAKAHGAQKLYISSHSAVETQAFYHAMGCVDAVEYNQEHVEKEPFDRQLEFVL